MNIAAVMDELGTALGTIEGLRVHPYWAPRVTPPSAVVGWPDPLTYDVALRRGGDQVELPVIVLAGALDARSARDVLAAYMDGAGPSSVKAAVEAHEAVAYDSARVARCEVSYMTVAGVQYLAATFYLDIFGKGVA